MAKMTKLGQGLLDLHSRRGEVDLDWLSRAATDRGGGTELAEAIARSNSAMEAFGHAEAAGIDLPASIAASALRTAQQALGGGIRLDVVIFDRSGEFLAQAESGH
jgi:cobalt-precorrin-5B (C1)-methyltransferase